MNFLADENIGKPVVDRLRKEGHLILYVIEMEPGIPDDEVLSRANREGALLLTGDKDFGELVFRQGYAAQRVILIRLAGVPPQRKAEITAIAIQEHVNELAGNFTVITPWSIRIRKLS